MRGYLGHSDLPEDERKYGIPKLKKYPMPDARHVRSAIKFFNYVDPQHEKELAESILRRMKEYGMSFDNFTVGEENRFSKYMPKEDSLAHHGILGQKWGVRRYQNSDGTLTEAGKARLKSDRSKLDERQSRVERWEDKANRRAKEYNTATRKLLNYPFERPVKKFKYDWSNFGHDRALNSANRWYKKMNKRYSKMNVKGLSKEQIKKGEEFMNWAQSNEMLLATINSKAASQRHKR